MVNGKMKQIIFERTQLESLVAKYGISHSEVFKQSKKIDDLVIEMHYHNLRT